MPTQDQERERYWANKKKTDPTKVEMLDRGDVRLSNRSGATIQGDAVKPNRADLRRYGVRGGAAGRRSPFNQMKRAFKLEA